MKQRLALAVFAATLCLSATSHAEGVPFGEGFGGWTFDQEDEKGGLVNCRAHYDGSGSGHFIIAMRTNDVGYVSISTPKGLKGQDTEARLIYGSDDVGVDAKVYGPRLVFSPMNDMFLSTLMAEGNFGWEAFGRSGVVDVGSDMVGEALARLAMCVEENK
jgi:hypothetical protein